MMEYMGYSTERETPKQCRPVFAEGVTRVVSKNLNSVVIGGAVVVRRRSREPGDCSAIFGRYSEDGDADGLEVQVWYPVLYFGCWRLRDELNLISRHVTPGSAPFFPERSVVLLPT